MSLIFRDSGPKLTDQCLDGFESDFHVKLPLEYRVFLKNFNGGKPKPSVATFSDSSYGDCAIRCFFKLYKSIDEPEFYNLKAELTYNRTSKRIPESTIPIAEDSFGNLICLGVDGEVVGKIYFWNHEGWNDGEEPSFSNMSLISSSLNELLGNLKEA